MPHWTIRLFAYAFLLIGASCGSSPKQGATPFTEPRVTSASRATKQLGEDCAANGSSVCLSGICGHFAPLPSNGHFCTRGCTTAGDCPEGWSCNQVYPTPRGWACVPPPNWSSKAIVVRGGGAE